jgi:hypothetical protein
MKTFQEFILESHCNSSPKGMNCPSHGSAKCPRVKSHKTVMEASTKKEHKKFKDVKEATDGIKARDYKGRLDKWFDDGGWVQTGGKYDGKPCAKQPGQTTKPYCRDPDDRAAMDEDERDKRAAKKRKEDPNPNRTGEAKMVTQESVGEKDACYKKVKSRYKVWPSAYASGALVKCRKVGADSWGTKSESTGALEYDWNTPIYGGEEKYNYKKMKNIKNIQEIYTRIQSRGSTYSIVLNWRGKYISAQMFFPQFARPPKDQVTFEVRKIYPGAIVLSYNPSVKDPTKPLLFTGNENGSK